MTVTKLYMRTTYHTGKPVAEKMGFEDLLKVLQKNNYITIRGHKCQILKRLPSDLLFLLG